MEMSKDQADDTLTNEPHTEAGWLSTIWKISDVVVNCKSVVVVVFQKLIK